MPVLNTRLTVIVHQESFNFTIVMEVSSENFLLVGLTE